MFRIASGRQGGIRFMARSAIFASRVWAVCLAFASLTAFGQTAQPGPGRIVTHYALVSGHESPEQDPKDWRLLGSNDNGLTWVTLDARSNQLFRARSRRRVFDVANHTPYATYRLQVLRNAEPAQDRSGDGSVELAEMELMGTLTGVAGEADLQCVITASKAHPLLGPPENAFDNEPSTEWIDYGLGHPGGCWLQCQYVRSAQSFVTNIAQMRSLRRLAAEHDTLLGQAGLVRSNLAVFATKPLRSLSGYALTSANDFPDRDPRDWRLLGSNDGGKTWTTLDARREEIFATRLQRRLFQVTNQSPFAVFRLEITATKTPEKGPQIAEVEPLYAVNQPLGRLSTVVSAAFENPPQETTDMAFDGDPKTKWLAFNPVRPGQPIWIQWQFIPEIEDQRVINRRLLNPSPEDLARILANLPAQSRKSTRELTGYALTSANDSPERDPRDWRLRGSRDDGASWDILDTRKDESFPVRFGRREFALKKPAKYPLYRLDIDSVRDPRTANSMQIAEIEPLWADPGRNSLYSLAIQAAGDNAPQEAAENAFDQDTGTKWLDFAYDSPTKASWAQWQCLPREFLPVLSIGRGRASRTQSFQPASLHLDGTLVCWNSASNVAGFLDQTGFQLFRLDAPPPVAPLGRRTRLEGQLHLETGIPAVSHSVTTVSGPLENVGAVAAGQAIRSGQGLLMGEVEGRAVAISQSPVSGFSTLRLIDENGSGAVLVRVLASDRADLENYRGLRVRVAGIISPVYGQGARRVVGQIWARDSGAIVMAAPSDVDWRQWPAWTPDALAATNPPFGHMISVRGRAGARNPDSGLDLDESGTSVTVYSPIEPGFAPGALVEAAGILGKEGSRLTLRPAYVRLAPKTAVASPAPALAPLDGVGEISDFFARGKGGQRAATARGVITYIDLGLDDFYIQDGTNSILCSGQQQAGVSPFLRQEGQYVQVSGIAKQGNPPFLLPTDFVATLGPGRMPEPLRHSWEYLASGKDDGKWVQVEGIISAFENERLTLSMTGGRLILWVNGIEKTSEDRLLGSLVTVNGVCSPVLTGRNQRLGLRLLVPSIEEVSIVKATPENSFDLPLTSIERLTETAPGESAASIQLVKTVGVVTHKEPRMLFIQDGGAGLRVALRGKTDAAPGDRVEAVGLLEPDGVSPKLDQAIVRKTGAGVLPTPGPIDLIGTDLTSDQISQDATRGQIDAVFVGQRLGETLAVLEFRHEKTGKNFFAFLPRDGGEPQQIAQGSRVRLFGVFKAKTDLVPDINQAVTSFEMYLNGPGDITVLSRPSWWTSAHTSWVLECLGAGLMLCVAWVWLLRKQVFRRTRDLEAEIAERERAEKQSAESEHRLRTILDSEPEGVMLIGPDGKILEINPAGLAMIEASRPDQAVGKPICEFVPPEHHGALEKLRLAVFRGETGSVEHEFVGLKDARRWTDMKACPLRDSGGAIVAMLAVTRDTTDRKDLEAQLRQSQKMEAVGRLAGGIAHDFNNILTVINGFSSVLLSNNNLDAATVNDLRQIQGAGERAANLTRQLLAFSRKQVLRARVLRLNDILQNTAELLGRLIGEDIALELSLDAGLPCIKADSSMVEQVLMNLAVNARDAMPRGGKLTLGTRRVQVTAKEARLRPEARPGDFILMSVRDTGCGIAPEALPRLFEPFYTTKAVGKGTGLGLAMVFGIVKQHQGWIEVESQIGRGAAFHVYWPVCDTAEAPPPRKAPSPPETRGAETILLVEDEPAVRKLAMTALQGQGYRVLEAASGPDALNVWSRNVSHISLLLTDIVMPGGMTGLELADKLKAEKPALKVICATGYSEDFVEQNGPSRQQFRVLLKPYQLRQLTDIVRASLDTVNGA
jgi:PAS domain S-box-containing protein